MTERISAREAIALVTDSFAELPSPGEEFRPDGPLSWKGYDEARARAAARTGEEESVVCGAATFGTASFGTTTDGRAPLGPVTAVLVAFEFGFLGGSLGERTGDRLEAAYDYARTHRLPVVSLVATGGSRMQEGMLALTQLQRVARQSALTREAGLAQIAVLRDPTTGGGWATLGAGADVTLALPGAQVAFAGSRVRPPDADPAAYTAEAQVAAGSVDALVPQDGLRETLALWLDLLTRPAAGAAPVPPALGPASVPSALGGATDLPATGWDAVQRARSPERPRADAYLDAYFTRRAAIGGDRCGGTDDGVLCGFGRARDGRTIAYAAQRGTPTRPAGYRTAARLVRLAGRLGIPVLTLVDTPGAANGADAERQGAGAAIADLFAAVATARTPVTTLVIGEGGSGGALALAAPGNTWATPDSYFSVIAPESAAAILKRPAAEVRATAAQLRLRPQDLLDLGVIRGITQRRPGT
ncbi:carboxyl transferase domain-containing protein [Streptomyces rhizosphaerihabitans]|uniref:carboxyl transferase domain-containing protein n=1 Tax=Streptomyces rhizosphaerihabitans TaxID=1266770 RepID=UPI0021C0522D|nr:carboxyl transferase domain-containing protein [Streptomyces rhizosphaerihabitans]MCT9004116.1 acetyl-CoA carboxylase [Streptomyces rhizosphaerihabitans]